MLLWPGTCDVLISLIHKARDAEQPSIDGPDANEESALYVLEIACSTDNSARREGFASPDRREPSTVWLNDNPVLLYAGGSISKPINHLIRNGVNLLSLTAPTGSLRIRIYAIQNDLADIVAERDVQASSLNSAETVQFDISLPYSMPIFADENHLPATSRAHKEIVGYVHGIDRICELSAANRCGDIWRRILMEGYSLWKTTAYANGLEAGCLNPIVSIPAPWELSPSCDNQIACTIGSSLALVHRGVFPQDIIEQNSLWTGPAYLTVIQNGEESFCVPAVLLAYVNGSWMVWDTATSCIASNQFFATSRSALMRTQ